MTYYVSAASFKRGNMVLHSSSECPTAHKVKDIVVKDSKDLVGKTYRRCSYCFG